MDVLKTARAVLNAKANGRPKILSFGCSIGEEIVTLKHIFPEAELFGCETDPATRAVAARSVGHLAVILESDIRTLAAAGPFELINCSAVLCLNPPTDISSRFPSTQFDETLKILDAVLCPGGLLAITNASYRFWDSSIAQSYVPVRSDTVLSSGFVDIFAHDGRSFLSRIPRHPRVAFHLGPAFALRDPEELADSVFCKRLRAGDGEPLQLRLAPVPPKFAYDFEFERSNLDGLDAQQRMNALEFVKCYRFGVDRATGQRGCSISASWDWGAGKYRRPSIWVPISDDATTEW